MADPFTSHQRSAARGAAGDRPDAAAAAPDPQHLPLSKEALGKWRLRIEAADKVAHEHRDDWARWTHAYMGKDLQRMPDEHTVLVNMEYAHVEQKKAQLAFQVPDVHLTPKLPGLEQAVLIFQGAVNHELGPDGAHVKAAIDECLTDVLICGIAAAKIGYVADIRTRMTPQTDPAGQPILGADGQPVLQPQSYAAAEDYFFDRFPPDRLLVPTDFDGSDFDESAYLGMIFFKDVDSAKREYGLPAAFTGSLVELPPTLSSEEQPDPGPRTTLQQVKGYEMWYRADIFDPESDPPPLPHQIRRLVLIEGHPEPVIHQDSPYQWVDETTGHLMGMEGFPIHPLTLRYLPGSAYPVSDVGVSRPVSEELNTGRSQMVQFRDRAMPMTGFDRTKLDKDTLDKVQRGYIGKFVGMDGLPSEVFQPIALPTYPRQNFDFDQIAKKDYQRLWAMSDNASAVIDDQQRTATEVQATQAASDVRLDAERTRVLNWFTRGASKFGSLLQQFKDDPGYALIVGADGVKALAAWNRHQIAGEYAYSAKPDSALRIDADVQRRQIAAVYNLTGKDPNVNRSEVLKVLFQRHDMDPSKLIVPTPPPHEPKPEPPKISISIKGEDLVPLAPQYGNVVALLQMAGVQLPPPPGQMSALPAGAQPGASGAPPQPGQAPPHGGPMPQSEPINKHELDRTQAPTKVM